MLLTDVVFYSKEIINSSDPSWWGDLANTIIGAVIGSGATIGAVYWGFRYDKKKERKQKKQFQIEKIRYFQSLVNSIIVKLKSQIVAYKTQEAQIRINPLEIPLLDNQQINELDRVVHKINQEEYFHALCR